MRRAFIPDPQVLDADSGEPPLSPPSPLVTALATVWIVLIMLGFIYGIAKRLVWHLFG